MKLKDLLRNIFQFSNVEKKDKLLMYIIVHTSKMSY